MKTRPLSISIVAAGATAVLSARAQVGTTAPSRSNADEERSAAWAKFLAGATKGSPPLMVEFREGEVPPAVPAEPMEPERLALALGREVAKVGGVTVLVRPTPSEAAEARSGTRLLNWISKLSAGDRRLLFEKGLSADRLEPALVDEIARASGSTTSSLRAQMATQPFTIQLGFAVQADYLQEGQARRASLTLSERPGIVLQGPDTPRPTAIKGLAPRFPDKTGSSGPLNWPEGAVRPLATLLTEVAHVSKARYAMDERQRTEWMFVRGNMALADFDGALAKLTTVPPAIPERTAASLARFNSMLDNDLAPEIATAAKGSNLALLRQGGNMTANELAQEFPQFKSDLARFGITDTMQAHVRLGLFATVNIPGRNGAFGYSFQTNAFP